MQGGVFALIAMVIAAICLRTVVSAPYQHLEPRPGYVPVYIRVGETPLNEIHPSLPAAFHEDYQQDDAATSPTAVLNATEAATQTEDKA